MSAHTPGPWRLGRLANISDYETVREMVGPHQVCVDNEFGPYVLAECNMNFPDDALANARLIAAAPELLEALKEALACGMVPVSSANEGGAVMYSEHVRVADMIRAAVAKAEGKQ